MERKKRGKKMEDNGQRKISGGSRKVDISKMTSNDFKDFKTYKYNFSVLPEDEKTRMEACNRFKIPGGKLKKMITLLSHKYEDQGFSWKINKMIGAVIGGLTKIYIAELAEEARLIQIEEYRIECESNNQTSSSSNKNECVPDLPIKVRHINRAYERLQSRDGLFQKIKVNEASDSFFSGASQFPSKIKWS